jgi:hypothetical protein
MLVSLTLKRKQSKPAPRCHRMTRRAGCQKVTTELSLQNSQSLSHLRYPTETRQLTSSQGEADGVSDGGMTLQALGGGNSPCGWYRVSGQLPSTGGREHTHTHCSVCTWGARVTPKFSSNVFKSEKQRRRHTTYGTYDSITVTHEAHGQNIQI